MNALRRLLIHANPPLEEILRDKKLARLGDLYVNLVWSLALSERYGEPTGVNVKSGVLAEALKRSGLRGRLPKRVDRHTQGDAAEALIVYSWLRGVMSLEESVEFLLGRVEEPIEAFASLLEEICGRLKDGGRTEESSSDRSGMR